MTDKKQLRKELITKRKKMTDEEFSKKSLRICNRLLNNSQYLKSKVIYCYYSVNKEVDLLPFIKQALEDGKIIAFPKVKGQNMDFFGSGGGFYDRFLEHHKVYTIGVAYDFQIMNSLPTEEHDRKLNEIISN